MNRLNKIMISMFAIIVSCGLLANITSAQVVIYNVPYARSLHDPYTETVIEIMNDTPVNVSVQVDWFNETGVGVGVSGPVVIPNNCARTFTTGGGGAQIEPYNLNVFRAPALPFEGYARIVTEQHVDALGVDAALVIDINPDTKLGANYKSIKVVRPPGNKGD